jgi:4-amino-4-deoxy-L-arabinose transferase-like glycosyltransferase
VLAGAALLASVGFFAYGRYVRPETLFVAALAWGFALTLEGARRGRSALAAGGLAAFGAAGLAKDPLGALGPPLAVGAALALAGCARPLRRWLPWPGVAALVGLGFGWWLLVEARMPGFAWYTVVDNHILNVARARVFPDEDVPLSAAEFLAAALLGAAPWALAAAWAVAGLVRRRAWRDPGEAPWVALGLWAAGVFALTALSPFRLPHYGLPAYPALALLAARAWQRPGRALVAVHVALLGAAAAACAALLAGDGGVFAGAVMGTADVATRKAATSGQASALPPWEEMRPLLGAAAVALGAGAVLLTALGFRARTRAAAPAAVALAMLAVMPLVGAALARVSAHRAVRGIARAVAQQAGPGDLVAHEGPIENSGAFEWYAGRRPVIVDGRRSVLGFGATLDGAGEMFWDAARLRAAWSGRRRVWLVSTRAPERSLAPALPGARLVAAEGGRWLWVSP